MTSASMVLTGDVNLRNVDDPDVPFGQVAETLSQADLVFGTDLEVDGAKIVIWDRP